MPNSLLSHVRRQVQRSNLSQPENRNFFLGVLNGAIFRISMVFIDSEVVVSWFLTQVGASSFLIGLVPPIRMGSSFLLQILVSGELQRRPFKLPFYRTLIIFRSIMLLGIAATMALVPLYSPWLVTIFFLLLTLYSMGAGLSSIAFMDVVGKAVESRRRGAFFGQRSFWGGILALGASAFVGFVLAEPGELTFPLNVALLFVLAMLAMALAGGLWLLVKEPPSEVVPERASFQDQVRRGAALVRDNRAYRIFLLSRLAAVVAAAAGPFYIVYAKTALGITAQMAGLYLTARTAAMILSNLAWGRINDRHGSRRVLQVTSALALVMPVSALVIGGLAQALPSATAMLSWAYGIVFVASGALLAGANIGSPGYLLDVAPSPERPLYLAFTNALFGMFRFTAMASGLIVDYAGFALLLGISAGFYALSLVLALLMVDLRTYRAADVGAG